MANNTANPGFNLAMDIVEAFPPKFWKKWNYGNLQFLPVELLYGSNEFNGIYWNIRLAQDKSFIMYYDNIESIVRIQNPYTYARFMLRKRLFEMMYGSINQVRKYMLIDIEHISLAVRYNSDVRRFGIIATEQIFTSIIPNIPYNYAVLVVQILTTEQDDGYSTFHCTNDSDFYVEYVVYFA